MNYYELAEEPAAVAVISKNSGAYRMSVYLSTLAIEQYLKSVLYRLDPVNVLLSGHDHIGIFRFLQAKYPKEDLKQVVKRSRKYFNDSRYSDSEDLKIYTEQFANEFIGYVEQIKNYVDIDCQATLDEMQKKYSNKHKPLQGS